MSDKPPAEGNLGVTMEDATISATGQIDIRAELVRIDRDRAETQKLQAETNKFVAEQRKLMAEGTKLMVDKYLAPLVLVASLLGGTIVAVLNHYWSAAGK
jgi:hypothetical protein